MTKTDYRLIANSKLSIIERMINDFQSGAGLYKNSTQQDIDKLQKECQHYYALDAFKGKK